MGILIWIGATVASFGFAVKMYNDLSDAYVGFALMTVGFACLLVTIVEAAEEWGRWRSKRGSE